MTQVIEGTLIGNGLRIGIVVSRFNELITSRLLEGALGTLRRHGVADDDITVAWVPGAFELPLIATHLAKSGELDAVIALGCVIRGATTHYDYVCNQAAQGVARASHETGLPVIFGVITTETLEQAQDRAGAKVGNKGADAALAAIETANLLKAIAVRNA